MAFNWKRFLNVLSGTTVFDTALDLRFRKIGEEIDKHAHDPKAIKEIGQKLIHDAPAIREAIKEGTEVAPVKATTG